MEFLRIDKAVTIWFFVESMLYFLTTGKKERMKKMREELMRREWNWLELLSAALHLFSVNIGAVLKVMAVVFLPISILQGLISQQMTINLQGLNAILQQVRNTAGALAEETLHLDATAIMPYWQGILTGEMLYLAVVLFLEPVGVIAVAKLVRQRIKGEGLSVKRALSEAIVLEPTIIVAGVIYGILVFLGGMVIIPGIYLSIAWCLYLYCIGLGGRKGWDSLRRSKELVRGRWWRTLGYCLALWAIRMLWDSVFQMVYRFGGMEIAKDILYYFLTYFSNAFLATGMALLFLNREALSGGLRFGDGVIDGEATEKEE